MITCQIVYYNKSQINQYYNVEDPLQLTASSSILRVFSTHVTTHRSHHYLAAFQSRRHGAANPARIPSSAHALVARFASHSRSSAAIGFVRHGLSDRAVESQHRATYSAVKC